MTAPYRMSRTELARLAAGEYLRNFWWMVASVPLFGLTALIFGQGLLQVIGMFALLWPFSIPARSVMTTSKSARLFTKGCRLRVVEDRLEFLGETPGKNGKPYRMAVPRETIRDVVRRGDYFLVRTYRLGIAPVLAASFATPGEAEAFVEELRPSLEENAA